jgi:hypothetical protein
VPAYRGPDGKIVYASDEDAGRFEAGGYERVGEATAGAAQNRITPVDNGITGSIGATVSAGLSGATLGASDWLLKGVLDKGGFEQMAQDRADNPGLSGAAQFAGAFLPAVVSGGSVTPSGYLSHLAAEGIGSAEAVGGAAGAAKSLAIAGSEGAIQNAGVYLSDVALGDRDLTAEGMVGALGTGFAFGGGGLIAGHAISAGTTAARRMFARYAAGGEEAALAAKSAWQEQSAKALESFDQAATTAETKLQEAQLARQQADLARKQASAAVADAKVAPLPPEAAAAGAGAETAMPGAAPAVSPEIEIAGLMRDRAMAATDPSRMAAWDAQNGQRLQELMGARVNGTAPADPLEAMAQMPGVQRTGPETAVRQGAYQPLPGQHAVTPDEAELAAKLSEYRAARDAFHDTHASVDPELDDVLRGSLGGDVQREPVPVGEFGAPGARGYDPGNVREPGPPSQAPLANAPEGTPVTRALRKPAASGEPTTAFDFKDSGLTFDPESRNYFAKGGGGAEPDLEALLGATKQGLDQGVPMRELSGKPALDMGTLSAKEPTQFTPTERPAGGSQGGKWYQDEHGQQWFGKSYGGNTDRIEGERLANRIYREFGVDAPETRIVEVGGKPTLMSREVPGEVATSAEDIARTNAKDGFVIDAWLANHDVVGTGYDNILVSGGKATRIDNGGATIWRARGEPKKFARVVEELTSMRDPERFAGKAFAGLTNEELQAQVQKFAQDFPAKKAAIDAAVDSSGLSATAKAKIKAGLNDRAEWLISEARSQGARELTEPQFRKMQRDARLHLTDDEIEQSLRYSREYYNEVNRHLRGTKGYEDIPASEKAIIPALDSVLEKSRLSEPVVTHRAVHFEPGTAEYKLKPGDVFSDPGYMSTSNRSENIERFGNVHFVITSPSGTKLAAIQSSKAEGELLLPRGSKLRITARDELPGGGVRLHATVESDVTAHTPAPTATTAEKPLKSMSVRELEHARDETAADISEMQRSPERRKSPEFKAAQQRYDDIYERMQAVKAGAVPEPIPEPAPPAPAAPATDTLTGLLRGTKSKLDAGESLVEMGAPARAEYATAKAAKTSEAAEHFRAKATAAREAGEATPEGGDLMAALQGTKQGLDSGKGLREIAGHAPAEHPLAMKQLELAHDDALERAAAAKEPAEKAAAQAEARAIEQQMTAVGKKPGAVEDVAVMAPAVHRLEKAAAELTEALGPEAPAAAQAHAKAFRDAEDAATQKSVSRAARAADDHASAQERAQADDLVNGTSARERAVAAAKRQRAEAEAAYQRAQVAEAEASIGAKQAKRAATEARKNLPPPPTGSPAATGKGIGGRIVSGAHAIGYAAELGSDVGIPGIPRPHDIPVIGPLLSAYLKYRAFRAAAGRFMGRIPATAETKAAELAARTRDGIARSMDRSLGLIERNPNAVRTGLTLGAIRASEALSKRLIDDGHPDAPDGASVSQLAAVRMREVANAVANPSLISDMVRQQTRNVVDPDLITALENHLTAMFQHLNDTAPKGPPPNPLAKQDWKPPAAAALQWGQRLAVAQRPQVAFDLLEAGKLTPSAADTLRVCYQKLFAEAQARLAQRAADLENPVPYRQLMQAGLLFDTPTHASLDPENATVLQQAHVAPPQPAPQPTAPPVPGVAAPTNVNALYQTTADRRAAR